MHATGQGPAGQEIGPLPSQFPDTGAGQYKEESPVLDKAMNLTEQFGDPLNLVYDHPALIIRGYQVIQPLRRSQQKPVEFRLQEIQVDTLLEYAPDPCGFAGSPGAKKKEAFGLRWMNRSGVHTSILHE
jgi:hypothetical protein